MLNIIIHGYKGKMGRVIARLIEEDGALSVAAGVDPFAGEGDNPGFPVYKNIGDCTVPADAIIDFSTAAAIPDLLAYVKSTKIPLVLCTTGLDDNLNGLCQAIAKETALFKSANMSLGINLLSNLLKKSAAILNGTGFDIEIIERHHNQKIDAPSGTALLLADAVNDALGGDMSYIYDRSGVREKRQGKEIGIHAVRGGTIVGDHTVLFAGNNEVIEFSHSAGSKEVFGVGAVNAAKFIAGKKPGLYDMQDLLEDLMSGKI